MISQLYYRYSLDSAIQLSYDRPQMFSVKLNDIHKIHAIQHHNIAH